MTLRPLTLVGIIISIVTGTSLGVVSHLYSRHHSPADASNTLSQALRQVSDNYVEEVSDTELLGFAIEGMMQGLDEHSGYLDASAYDALRTNTTGKFVGIGIELGLVDGYFTVIAPIDNTPAQQAGLKAGDRITGLQGDPVKGMKLMELVKALRGDPGSHVSLTITRQNPDASLDDASFDVDLERAVVQMASVRGRLLEPGYGYARISQFQNTTGKDLATLLNKLKKQSQMPLQGLVLDLRNNPGGTLQSSVEVADHFLEKGLIVYTKGRLKTSHAKYQATAGDLTQGAPIVVLINSGSASASEIVAGALQDHGRAQLMGSTSYGKGSVQSVLPLDDEQALKLTTAYYFTPKGRSIHNNGIDPDVAFEGEEDDMLEQAIQILKANAADTLQARL
ncbi:MAG: S41 family peptidase [Gammaproteobacteria bacterium]|nr:S41 family peptidase [Gammaproteobacteria bacterium]